jgi:NAD(P)-dependent dehydrogenase (short-subunit alcohol dehydrogenase family)
MTSIEGRTALVTGAAGGIGLGIAQALIAAGAKVVLSDLDRDELELQVDRLGPNAVGYVLDVADRSAWPDAKRFVEARCGPVDILVNNAGIGPNLQPLADMTPEVFDLMLRIKLNGAFNGVHTFAPGMRDRRVGHIVNTASMAGVTVTPRLGAYTTAMFGLVGMTEVLRVELEPYDVGASVLCPGRVLSRLGETTRAISPQASPTEISGPLPLPTSPSLSALEPRAVGEIVVDAIRANELYIFTHGEYDEIIDKRGRRLLEAVRRTPRRG